MHTLKFRPPLGAVPAAFLAAFLAALLWIALLPRACAQALPDLGGRTVVAVTENAFAPLNMRDPKTGQGVGWEYDAFNEIARRLHLRVDWRISSWDVMIESVRDGQFDVAMDGIAINAQRRQQIEFSDPYMQSQMYMLVRASETRFADPLAFRANPKLLAGAQAGTTGFYSTAKELLGASSVNGANPRIKLFDTFGATAQALRAGDVDVVLADLTGATTLLRQYPATFRTVGTPLQGEQYGFVLRKGSALTQPVNAALAAMLRDGTIARLNAKWLPPAPR